MSPTPFDALEAFLQEHPRFQLKAPRTVTVPISFEIG